MYIRPFEMDWIATEHRDGVTWSDQHTARDVAIMNKAGGDIELDDLQLAGIDGDLFIV